MGEVNAVIRYNNSRKGIHVLQKVRKCRFRLCSYCWVAGDMEFVWGGVITDPGTVDVFKMESEEFPKGYTRGQIPKTDKLGLL